MSDKFVIPVLYIWNRGLCYIVLAGRCYMYYQRIEEITNPIQVWRRWATLTTFWYNRAMDVMRVTNPFLLELILILQDGNRAWQRYEGQEPMAIQDIGCEGEPTTITLPIGHSIKPSFKNMHLSQYITSSLRPYQRSCFLKLMMVNTETHSWSVCKGYVTVECSVLNGKSIRHSPLFLRLRNPLQQRDQKDNKIQMWWMSTW